MVYSTVSCLRQFQRTHGKLRGGFRGHRRSEGRPVSAGSETLLAAFLLCSRSLSAWRHCLLTAFPRGFTTRQGMDGVNWESLLRSDGKQPGRSNPFLTKRTWEVKCHPAKKKKDAVEQSLFESVTGALSSRVRRVSGAVSGALSTHADDDEIQQSEMFGDVAKDALKAQSHAWCAMNTPDRHTSLNMRGWNNGLARVFQEGVGLTFCAGASQVRHAGGQPLS